MSNSPDRQFKRAKAKEYAKRRTTLFHQALKEGEKSLGELKRIISNLPLLRRIWIALQIVFKRWGR